MHHTACYLSPTGSAGKYLYTEDLLRLDGAPTSHHRVDQCISAVSTPLKLPAWRQKLAKHPDREYATYILNGIDRGFRIGADDARMFTPAKQNMLSARQHPEVIQEYITKQVELGNILGPFAIETAPKVHINRFGAIPKKHQPGKWRVITDLSYPRGQSINDAIDPTLWSVLTILHYSGPGSEGSHLARKRCPNGQDRHKVGIPPRASVPCRSKVVGHEVGQQGIC